MLVLGAISACATGGFGSGRSWTVISIGQSVHARHFSSGRRSGTVSSVSQSVSSRQTFQFKAFQQSIQGDWSKTSTWQEVDWSQKCRNQCLRPALDQCMRGTQKIPPRPVIGGLALAGKGARGGELW